MIIAKNQRFSDSTVWKHQSVEQISRFGRAFEKFQKIKIDSSYANHLFQNSHIFVNIFYILHVHRNYHKLNYLESLEINHRKITGNLLNGQAEVNNSLQ